MVKNVGSFLRIEIVVKNRRNNGTLCCVAERIFKRKTKEIVVVLECTLKWIILFVGFVPV